MKNQHAVYLIRSLKDGSFYVGISIDPFKRLLEHNSGKLKVTRSRKPFELMWYKYYDSAAEARKHEKWLKKKSREYKNKLAEVAQLAPPEIGGVK